MVYQLVTLWANSTQTIKTKQIYVATRKQTLTRHYNVSLGERSSLDIEDLCVLSETTGAALPMVAAKHGRHVAAAATFLAFVDI